MLVGRLAAEGREEYLLFTPLSLICPQCILPNAGDQGSLVVLNPLLARGRFVIHLAVATSLMPLALNPGAPQGALVALEERIL